MHTNKEMKFVYEKGEKINMDKSEVLKSLAKMFEKTEESNYVIEEQQIDKNTYLTLIAKNEEDFITTHPDFEMFVNILQYHNTKNLNFVASKLKDNKRKIFMEFTDDEKEKFLVEIRDLHNRLVRANQKNLAFIELMVVDWIEKLFNAEDSI